MIEERKLEARDIVPFWKHMLRRHHAVVIQKGEAVEMRAVAEALALLRIQDVETFLGQYATTLGNRIYIPFVLGEVGRGAVPLVRQVAVCVHEHVHVRQFKDPAFAAGYVVDSAKRATYECEALRADMEVEFALTGRCPAAATLARRLAAYACSEADIEYAAAWLRKAAPIVRKGGVVTPEAQVALAWLRQRGVLA